MADHDVEFAIALAPEWEQLDLLAPDAERIIDGTLAAALQDGAHGGPHARILMVRSLYAITAGGQPLAAGLAVTLADPRAPVSSGPLGPEAFGDSEVAAVALPVGSGLRVRDIAPEAVIGGVEIPVLRVQYLVHTDLGLLTITLTTPQAAQTEEWEQLFDAMAQTAELAGHVTRLP